MRPCSLRTVQAWLAKPGKPSARHCPDWALAALEARLLGVGLVKPAGHQAASAKTTLKPSQILQSRREDIRRVVKQNRARNPRVFGSVLRRSDTGRSDLDLLVEPLPGATLLDMGAIQAELEDMLGIPVDVLTPGDLPARFRGRVLREAIPI